MKKFITLLIASMLISLACVGLTACSDESEYDKIELTTTNYSEYLTLNIYYSDCTFVVLDNSTSTYTHYTLSCTCNFETSKNGNYYFEDVEIEYTTKLPLTWSAGSASTKLDYNGNSHCTLSRAYTDTITLKFPSSDSSYSAFRIESITGSVLVPKG